MLLAVRDFTTRLKGRHTVSQRNVKAPAWVLRRQMPCNSNLNAMLKVVPVVTFRHERPYPTVGTFCWPTPLVRETQDERTIDESVSKASRRVNRNRPPSR